MASCITAQWSNKYTPQANLTVEVQSETPTSATLHWKLEYVAHGYEMRANPRTYSVTINGNKVTTSGATFAVRGITGTKEVCSGDLSITKTHNSQTIDFSVTFGFGGITWSGVKQTSDLTADGDISIGAKSSYVVSYDGNGSSTNVPGSQTKWYGEALTLSSTVPTRIGYKFNGWKNLSTGTSYNPGSSFTANTSMKLTAQWVPYKLSITYNADGGKQKTGNNLLMPYTNYAYYDSPYNGVSGLFDVGSFGLSRTGHHISSSDSAWRDSDGAVYSQSTPINSGQELATRFGKSIDNKDDAINLYPAWERNFATVTFKSNGSTSGTQTSKTTAYYGETYDGIKDKFSKMKLVKTGHHVVPGEEWVTSDGVVVSESSAGTGGSTFINKYFGETLESTSGKTYNLFANWKPNELKIRYNINKSIGEVQGSDAISKLPLTITAIYDEKFIGIHNADASFKLTRSGYHLKSGAEWRYITASGDTGTINQQIETLYPSGLLGKDIAEEGFGITNMGTTQEQTVQLYANWEINTYNVSFNDGDGNTINTVEVQHGTTLTLDNNPPSKSGYRFMHWVAPNGSTYPLGTKVSGITSDITLTAVWQKLLDIRFYRQTSLDVDPVLITEFQVVADEEFTSRVPKMDVGNFTFVGNTKPITVAFKFGGSVVHESSASLTGVFEAEAKWCSEPFREGALQKEITISPFGVTESTNYYVKYRDLYCLSNLYFPIQDGVLHWGWESEQISTKYLPGTYLTPCYISADPVFIAVVEGTPEPNLPNNIYVHTSGGNVSGTPYVKVKVNNTSHYALGVATYVRVNNQWVLSRQ